MAQAKAVKNYFTFVAGLVTEASPLTFPENASYDEDNFVLQIDGSRKRRKGINYSATAAVTVVSTDAVGCWEWRTVAGDSSINFVVVQAGSTIHFFKQVDEELGDQKKSFTVNLLTYKVSGTADATVAGDRVSVAYGKGYLFIVGKYIEPLYISYTSGSDSITVNQITVEERDFEGVDDSLGVADNPSTLSDEHLYNLLNQGWEDTYITSFASSTGTYPSNAQIQYMGKYTNVSSGKEAWAYDQLTSQYFGNTRAPMGHFVRNVFDTTQSYSYGIFVSASYTFTYAAGTVTITTGAAHGLTTGDSITITGDSFNYDNGDGGGCSPAGGSGSLNGTYTVTVTNSTVFTITKTITAYVSTCSHTDGTITKNFSNSSGTTESYRPSATAFYAGRVWYAGVPSSRIGSHVYFSQVLENTDKIGKCYQDADPTSEHISDLIATDGGFIVIPDIGQVLAMVPVSTVLAVFATNGVWLIAGSDEESFTAKSYSVRRVMEDQLNAPGSIVNVEGTPVFWTGSGIYTLQQDKITGFLTPQNISFQKIHSLFTAIPYANLAYIQGAYNPINKTVVWAYNSANTGYKYNKLLALDLRLNAFSKHSVSTATPYIIGLAPVMYTLDEIKKVQYIAYTDATHIAFCAFTSTTFKDWYAYDSTGVEYTSYLETGYELAQDAMRNKFVPYVYCYFNKTETGFVDDGTGNIILENPSGCYMQARWNWADHSNSGKYGPNQQVYRFHRNYIPSGAGDTFTTGEPVTYTKNKVRGTGKALQLKFTSESGKDCWLLGWAIEMTGNTNV